MATELEDEVGDPPQQATLGLEPEPIGAQHVMRKALSFSGGAVWLGLYGLLLWNADVFHQEWHAGRIEPGRLVLLLAAAIAVFGSAIAWLMAGTWRLRTKEAS